MIFLYLLFIQIEAKAELAKEFINKRLTIGDPFEIIVNIETPSNKNLSEPSIDSIEPFAILSQAHKIIQEKGRSRHTYHFKATAFNTGELKFPAIKFFLKDKDKIDTIATNMIDIKIASLLPEGMRDINDIKEMIEFPNPLPVVLLIVAICAGLLTYLGIKLYKKLKKKEPTEEEKIPCWERALNSLDTLIKEDLINKGLIKRFYYTLTEIIKHYLEERFNFPAIEQTTTEILQSMKLLKIPLRDEFQDVFQYADMVKYAKFVPPPTASEEIVKKSRELILKTIPANTGEER